MSFCSVSVCLGYVLMTLQIRVIGGQLHFSSANSGQYLNIHAVSTLLGRPVNQIFLQPIMCITKCMKAVFQTKADRKVTVMQITTH